MNTYSIRPTDDLGALPAHLAAERMTHEQLDAWMAEHGEDGTHVIIDDRDGLPACGHDIGTAGGACGCECHRATCPDAIDDDFACDMNALAQEAKGDGTSYSGDILSSLLEMLADEPPEIAARWGKRLRGLADRTSDTGERGILARAADILDAWKE